MAERTTAPDTTETTDSIGEATVTESAILDLSRANIEPDMLPGGILNTYALACCLAEAIDRGITPPNVGAFQAIVEEDAEFAEQLNEYYPDDRKGEEVGLGLDTMEREILLEILAQRFAGRSWPINMDSAEVSREFAHRMHESLVREGWGGFGIRWDALGIDPPGLN